VILNLTETDAALIVASYFIGSVPFGFLIAKLLRIGDLRKLGSGNIGATNVLRLGGKKLGVVTLLLDAGKGAIAVFLARKFASDPKIMMDLSCFCGGAAVIGHIFPLWLKFKGGKGVATTFAVLLTLYWPLGLMAIFVWLATFFFTKISSLSAILAMIATPTLALYFSDKIGYEVVYLSFFTGILVIVRHHSNIQRLVQGEENRIV